MKKIVFILMIVISTIFGCTSNSYALSYYNSDTGVYVGTEKVYSSNDTINIYVDARSGGYITSDKSIAYAPIMLQYSSDMVSIEGNHKAFRYEATSVLVDLNKSMVYYCGPKYLYDINGKLVDVVGGHYDQVEVRNIGGNNLKNIYDEIARSAQSKW